MASSDMLTRLCDARRRSGPLCCRQRSRPPLPPREERADNGNRERSSYDEPFVEAAASVGINTEDALDPVRPEQVTAPSQVPRTAAAVSTKKRTLA